MTGIKNSTIAGCHNYSNEEMIRLAQEFYNKHHKIVLRDFVSKNNLPSSVTMLKQFGSLKNLLFLSGINISDKNKHNFDRVCLSDDKLLNDLKIEVKKHLQNHVFLMTYDEIDENKNLQSSSTYLHRFGTLDKIYELIGYSKSDINNNNFEYDMLLRYKKACEKYHHTLNSREITSLNKNNPDEIYATATYLNHFGSLYNLQQKCNCSFNVIGRNITKEEALNLLKQLSKELNHTPKQQDIIKYDYMPSCSYYFNTFGTFRNALKLAGLKSSKTYITSKGTKCNSAFEYKLALTLEKFNVDFKKEVMYSKVIPNFNRRYRFDFEIKFNSKLYYIELFGIKNNEKYNQRKQEKISLCKQNNIPLIELYQEDILLKTESEIYGYIKQFIQKEW